MVVRSLEVKGFRNYEQVQLAPCEGVNVFVGPNAQGKTNLLEALHLCCTGRSHRTPRDEELIRWGEAAARVTAQTVQRDGTHETHKKA